MLQCVAVCCSVLRCVAVCCSVLQCVAVWDLFLVEMYLSWSASEGVGVCPRMVERDGECVQVWWSVLKYDGVCLSVLRCVLECVGECVGVCCRVCCRVCCSVL